MTSDNSSMSSAYRRFRPHMLMVLVQMSYTLLYFFTEASFNHGMNPHVYVTYRHIVGGLVMFPFAYFLERKQSPKLTLALATEIFVLSLFGVGLTLNTYFASFRYTSPTFIASMVNTIASLTFVIAVVLRLVKLLAYECQKSRLNSFVCHSNCSLTQSICRLEVVDIWNYRGIAKVIGTLVSLAGVMIMTLYKGSTIRNIWHPLMNIQGTRTIHEDWLKGSLLTITSCITWSIWYIMQALTIKRYPAPLSLTTWMSCVGAAQSAIYTLCVQHKAAAWAIGFNIDLWSTIYAGVVCSGLVVVIQLSCTEEKGPVFVTMFNPLTTILVAIVAYFVLGEKLCLGSIIGASIVICGMYLVLWGKEEQGDKETPSKSNTNYQESGDVDPGVFTTSKYGNKVMREP